MEGAYVWGCDPSTKRLAVGFDGPSSSVAVVEFPRKLHYGARLAEIHRLTRNFAVAHAERFPPTIVWVEQPGGPQVSPPLLYAVGVIQAALYEGLRFAQDHPTEIRTVTAPTWKSTALGKGFGFAKKEQVVEWARARGHDGLDSDSADALAIAYAGRRLLEGERLEAAKLPLSPGFA